MNFSPIIIAVFRRARLIANVSLAGFLALSCAPASRDATESPYYFDNPAPTTASNVQAVREASSPSALIDAYVRGAADDRANPAILDAYVHRMVEFGLPEMAEAQALALTVQQPQLGQPWAVAAYMNARRGQTPAALVQIQLAADRAPDDPFVLRTAAQLTAWYDTRADRDQLIGASRDAIENVRGKYANNSAFSQAYASALNNYRQATTAPSTRPGAATRPLTDIMPIEIYSAPQVLYPAPNSYARSYSPAYTDPYAINAYSPDLYWLPGPYYSRFYWDSFFWPPPIFFFSHRHHHHDHHDGDGNDHHAAQVSGQHDTPSHASPSAPGPQPHPAPAPVRGGGMGPAHSGHSH